MSVTEFYLRNLQKSPGYRKIYKNSWADYIELVCLANVDGEVSEADIVDRLSERVKDLKEDATEELTELDKLEAESDDGSELSRRAEVSDKWDIRVRDYFKILSLRQSLYGDIYPFSITDDYIRRKPNLEEHHILYIYLVLCSNLYLFDRKTINDLANSFELISFNAFKKLLPPNADVHLFGKNPYNRKGKFSAGKFWNKLNRLVNALHEKKSPHLKKADFSDRHTGDEGLDIVAWIPTGDELSSSLIHFAQCACTYNFVEKQHSSSYSAWIQRIVCKNPPSNSTFIPHCYRGADGSWIKSDDIQSTFLIDRKRLITYYSDSEKYKFKQLKAFKIVKEIVNVKEAVV